MNSKPIFDVAPRCVRPPRVHRSNDADPWVNLFAAVLLRAVEDAKLERTYGLHTPAMKAKAQQDALHFLESAGPLFDLVGIDHAAAGAALGFPGKT